MTTPFLNTDNENIYNELVDILAALGGGGGGSGLATEATLQSVDVHVQQAVAELGDISTFTQDLPNILAALMDGGISVAQISSDNGNKLNSILNEVELMEASTRVQHITPTYFSGATVTDLNVNISAFFSDPANVNKRLISFAITAEAGVGYSAIVNIGSI